VAELGALGLLAAVGIALVLTRLPVLRRPSLQDRLAPYLAAAAPPSALLVAPQRSGPWAQLGRQLIGDASRVAEPLLAGRASVARRLARLGPTTPTSLTVETFRQQQLLAAFAGALLGAALLALRLGAGLGLPAVSLAAATLGLAAAGGWLRDQALTRTVRRRQRRLAAQLPHAAELLALAVSAGESPVAALERVSRVSPREIGQELAGVVADVRAGCGIADGLARLRDRTDVASLVRFADAMTVAISRGTPLAGVLRAQASDAREAAKRDLLEAGGRNEVRMLLPVVFLLLPVTLLFALYPAAITLTTLTH
jgi:tight adherence protein C